MTKELTMRNGEVVDAVECPDCGRTPVVSVSDAPEVCPVCGGDA